MGVTVFGFDLYEVSLIPSASILHCSPFCIGQKTCSGRVGDVKEKLVFSFCLFRDTTLEQKMRAGSSATNLRVIERKLE